MSASVVGVWGYEAAKRHARPGSSAVELQDVGGIVESQIDRGHRVTFDGGSAASARRWRRSSSAARSAAELQDRLRTVQSFDPRFLQIGRLRSRGPSRRQRPSEDGAREEASRVAIAFSLDGKPFVSEALFSATHKRQVIYVGLPLRDGAGPVVGVVGAWYDLQSELTELRQGRQVQPERVRRDGRRRRPDHRAPRPDAAQRGCLVVPGRPAGARSRPGRSAHGAQCAKAVAAVRLPAHRRIPATLAQQPWVLLTEINADEQLAPLRRLRRELALGIALVLAGRTDRGASGVAVDSAAAADPRRLRASHRHGRPDRARGAERPRRGRPAGRGAERDGRRGSRSAITSRRSSAATSPRRCRTRSSAARRIWAASRATSRILFSDIRNFTAMAEQMTPPQVVTFLNDYFSEMVDAVFEQNGMLDKFLGDGLMAVFGVFGDEPDHPRRAVLAALRMKALLAKINGERAMAGKPPIAIGIGIHSDEVIVGNIGSRKRLEFTVVGDGVNVVVAAADAQQGIRHDDSHQRNDLRRPLKDEFECRLMPEAPLRGRAGS